MAGQWNTAHSGELRESLIASSPWLGRCRSAATSRRQWLPVTTSDADRQGCSTTGHPYAPDNWAGAAPAFGATAPGDACCAGWSGRASTGCRQPQPGAQFSLPEPPSHSSGWRRIRASTTTPIKACPVLRRGLAGPARIALRHLAGLRAKPHAGAIQQLWESTVASETRVLTVVLGLGTGWP